MQSKTCARGKAGFSVMGLEANEYGRLVRS